MEETQGTPLGTAPQGPDEEPSSADEAWSVLDTLTEPERRFVTRAISGGSWSECAAAGGWRTEEAIARVLGRPRVRAALERIAPLLGASDPKRATALLRPYLLMKLTETAFKASDTQSTQAIKELLAVDGATKGDRIVAGLMDVLGAVERRLSARTVDAEVVKVPELPASVSDLESPGTTPIGIATIPDAADSSGQTAPATGAAKRTGRRGRRGTKPSP